MTYSDLLSSISILTSIVFGFYITHWYSIRDSRTRVVKDYYIEQVKGIKGRVDKFFHQVAWGQKSARYIISWNKHIDLDIDSIDNGVRKVLDIHIASFGDLLATFYQEITMWDDYNTQFGRATYIPSTVNTERLIKMMSEMDNALNDYIDHINQANNFSVFQVQKRKIAQNARYFKEVRNLKYPYLCAVRERIGKHFCESLIIVGAFCFCIYLCCNLKREEKPVDLSKPLNNIANKQDSIYNAINEFKVKYRPVEVKTKSFYNSSFFSADEVDSVSVKVYQGK